MVEPGGVLCFTAEAGNESLIPGKLGMEDLDGDASTKGDVLGGEDISHATSGEVAGNSIAAFEHAWFSHGGEC